MKKHFQTQRTSRKRPNNSLKGGVSVHQIEVGSKLNAFLMPRMMEMMPKMKQMQQDFMTEAKAGQAAPGKP